MRHESQMKQKKNMKTTQNKANTKHVVFCWILLPFDARIAIIQYQHFTFRGAMCNNTTTKAVAAGNIEDKSIITHIIHSIEK